MKELLEKFEDYLFNNLPKIDTFHPHFENAMQDMLKAGGKRFRPMLLLSVVNSKKPLLVENSLKVALAVEFLHTYSLVPMIYLQWIMLIYEEVLLHYTKNMMK